MIALLAAIAVLTGRQGNEEDEAAPTTEVSEPSPPVNEAAELLAPVSLGPALDVPLAGPVEDYAIVSATPTRTRGELTHLVLVDPEAYSLALEPYARFAAPVPIGRAGAEPLTHGGGVDSTSAVAVPGGALVAWSDSISTFVGLARPGAGAADAVVEVFGVAEVWVDDDASHLLVRRVDDLARCYAAPLDELLASPDVGVRLPLLTEAARCEFNRDGTVLAYGPAGSAEGTLELVDLDGEVRASRRAGATEAATVGATWVLTEPRLALYDAKTFEPVWSARDMAARPLGYVDGKALVYGVSDGATARVMGVGPDGEVRELAEGDRVRAELLPDGDTAVVSSVNGDRTTVEAVSVRDGGRQPLVDGDLLHAHVVGGDEPQVIAYALDGSAIWVGPPSLPLRRVGALGAPSAIFGGTVDPEDGSAYVMAAPAGDQPSGGASLLRLADSVEVIAEVPTSAKVLAFHGGGTTAALGGVDGISALVELGADGPREIVSQFGDRILFGRSAAIFTAIDEATGLHLVMRYDLAGTEDPEVVTERGELIGATGPGFDGGASAGEMAVVDDAAFEWVGPG